MKRGIHTRADRRARRSVITPSHAGPQTQPPPGAPRPGPLPKHPNMPALAGQNIKGPQLPPRGRPAQHRGGTVSRLAAEKVYAAVRSVHYCSPSDRLMVHTSCGRRHFGRKRRRSADAAQLGAARNGYAHTLA
ncbi:unnamed protein product [Gadus morhua 'NCC']